MLSLIKKRLGNGIAVTEPNIPDTQNRRGLSICTNTAPAMPIILFDKTHNTKFLHYPVKHFSAHH
jgi:hypothetical protein